MGAPRVALERTMIKRAMNEVLICGLSNHRLDIEPVSPVRRSRLSRPLLSECLDPVRIEGAGPL
jgi:hypothetical protein